MSGKYSSRKRIKVVKFREEDHVSVEIARAIRHSSNLRRLPSLVPNRWNGRYPTYKLMSEYGVINRRVAAATLMPYTAVIKTGPPNVQLSPSEAYKLFQMSEATFCHCKKSCNTTQCRCYAASNLCTSHCHKCNTTHCRKYRGKSQNIKGVDDSCQITSDHDLILPVFGVDIMINENLYRFFNTCAVDTWIAIFATLMRDSPPFFLRQVAFFLFQVNLKIY